MRGFSFTKSIIGFALAALTLLAMVIALAIFGGRRTQQAGAFIQRGAQASAEAALGQPDAARRTQLEEAYGKLPLSFEANGGQTDERVKFLARGEGYGLFLTADEAVLTLRQDGGRRETRQGTLSPSSSRAVVEVLRTKLVGANSAPTVSGQAELAHKSNYFIGNDPSKWRTSVSNYGQVRYDKVYPGIDLIYYGNQRQLEYDFILAPGADTHAIRLSFDGARAVRVDESGELVLKLAGGEVRQHRPVVYQEIGGVRQEVAGHYVLKGKSEVGFEVGQYDASQPLVIDPVLVYSTYLGGLSADSANGVAIDAQGNAYLTGSTNSLDFPVTPGAFQSTIINDSYSDAFVTKINPTGTALVYSTYLGAGAGDSGKGIGVDAQGNAYVTGVTDGSAGLPPPSGFPTVNAFQSTFGGTDDAFVTKLNPTGSQLIFSTYMGGNDTDIAYRLVVNAATGEAYVA
ncbi:MAG: SBBP repeat-containing protein, partial [Acidobacteria bacterium]|nr:SBBP repeat-containing protein [Acidobacteriota bacterium]